MTFWHLIVWQVNRYGYHPPNLFQPLFCVRDHCGTKLIKGYAEPSMIRLLHVDQGKLSKCGHNNMLETVIFNFLDPLYFGHLFFFNISIVKYAFQICEILRPF